MNSCYNDKLCHEMWGGSGRPSHPAFLSSPAHFKVLCVSCRKTCNFAEEKETFKFRCPWIVFVSTCKVAPTPPPPAIISSHLHMKLYSFSMVKLHLSSHFWIRYPVYLLQQMCAKIKRNPQSITCAVSDTRVIKMCQALSILQAKKDLQLEVRLTNTHPLAVTEWL